MTEVCSICCFKHSSDQPHNITSNYYRRDFKAQHGRWPTITDTMSHCSEDVKAYWIKHYTEAHILLNEPWEVLEAK